jgi:hypothetical protein
VAPGSGPAGKTEVRDRRKSVLSAGSGTVCVAVGLAASLCASCARNFNMFRLVGSKVVSLSVSCEHACAGYSVMASAAANLYVTNWHTRRSRRDPGLVCLFGA